VTTEPLLQLACLVSVGVALTACNATVVSGGLRGDSQGGGGSGGSEPVDASTGSGPPSSGSGAPVAEQGGVVIPDDDDEVLILLGNFAQTCDAPQTEPLCAPGAWWLATIRMKTTNLAPGNYPLNTGETAIDLSERSDCRGYGGAGWHGEPAYLTIDTVDTAHVRFSISNAYDGVDGTWDVPLCGVTLP
jgi:hypothetical protein